MRKSTISLLCGIATFLATPCSAMVDGNVGEITQIYVYSDYGDGDVVIRVQNPLPGCQAGFWLRMTDVGAKLVYAKLLTAHETKSALRITAYDGHFWAGSTGQYCRIHMVGTPG